MTVADYTETAFARLPRLHHKDALVGPSSAGFGKRNLVGMMGVMMASGAKTPTARSYVQSGLLSQFDGIENAGFGTHESGARWVDLVGSSTLTPLRPNEYTQAFEWREDSLYRNTETFSNPQWTASTVQGVGYFEIVFSEASKVNRGIIVSNGGRTAGNIFFIRNSSTQVQTLQYANNRDITVDTSCRHTFGLDTATGSLWMDGVSYAGSARSDSWAASDILAIFGGTYASANAEICAMRFYSSVLPSASIAKNSSIDKARFNF